MTEYKQPRAIDSLEYNEIVKGDHPVNKIREICSNLPLSEGQILALGNLRKCIIEQKAYNAFDLTGQNLYKDVAVDACLHGQLTLLDEILTNAIVSP